MSFSSTRVNAEFLTFGLAKTSLLRPASTQSDDLSIIERASDEALVALIRDDVEEAIGCLFRRYAKAILVVGKRILRDPMEAEDLVQEVFLYVFKKCSLYDSSKGSARSWLVQIAYTQAFMRRRKLKSIGLYETYVEEGKNAQPTEVAYDNTVEALFGRNCWKATLDDLTSDQEQVLRLHFFEGYTFAEIAGKLGQSYANVRNHYYRGLEKLRKHLAADELNAV